MGVFPGAEPGEAARRERDRLVERRGAEEELQQALDALGSLADLRAAVRTRLGGQEGRYRGLASARHRGCLQQEAGAGRPIALFWDA